MSGLTSLARVLRTDATMAERLLWARLRGRALAGAKFRRQVPVGPYIVDFLCAKKRLVVEVDGGQHAGSTRDALRDALLAQWGWRVARYWNHEVLGDAEAVLHDIARRLAAPRPLTPTLSRKGRGGAALSAGARHGHSAPSSPFAPPLPLAGEGRGEGAAEANP